MRRAAPQVVAAHQRGVICYDVAIPDAEAVDEAESNGEASSVEGEYSRSRGLLDELAKGGTLSKRHRIEEQL